MRFLISVLFSSILLCSCFGPESGPVASIPDSAEDRDDAVLPDTDDNVINDSDNEKDWAEPVYIETEALIITTESLRQPFDKLAALHTLTGIPTEVETVENICGTTCNQADPRSDAARHIKDFIMAKTGLRYVILGGDIEAVPSRLVHDKYSNIAAGTYEEDFYTDYYYSDFSDWDSNNNGIYAEPGIDQGISYKASVPVSRISVSAADEAELYYEKVIRYISDYPTQSVKKALLLANIATSFNGIEINAGYYFEADGKTASVIPQDFQVTRLYAQTLPPPSLSASPLSNQAQIDAYNEGYNIVIHNGHGYPSLLNCEQEGSDFDFTGEMAYQLTNTTLPIYLSCACQAGQFEAPFTWHYINSKGEAKERVFPEDSAGELLMNAPAGGAIAYLGNTTTGLGLAGGSQFIDEMLKHIFTAQKPVLGDALLAAHLNLKDSDTFAPPIVAVPIPVVDRDSYEWTQKAIVLLGDLMIPVWIEPLQKAPELQADIEKSGDEGVHVRITFPVELPGKPIMAYADGAYYELDAFSGETAEYYFKGTGIESVLIGYPSTTTQYFFREYTVR